MPWRRQKQERTVIAGDRRCYRNRHCCRSLVPSYGSEKVSQFKAAFGAEQWAFMWRAKLPVIRVLPKSKMIIRKERVNAQHECRWRPNLLYLEIQYKNIIVKLKEKYILKVRSAPDMNNANSVNCSSMPGAAFAVFKIYIGFVNLYLQFSQTVTFQSSRQWLDMLVVAKRNSSFLERNAFHGVLSTIENLHPSCCYPPSCRSTLRSPSDGAKAGDAGWALGKEHGWSQGILPQSMAEPHAVPRGSWQVAASWQD